MNRDFYYVFVYIYKQAVNDRADDPDARPMLYDPLQGGKTTKTQQYLATIIGMYCSELHLNQFLRLSTFSESRNLIGAVSNECKRSLMR